LAGGLVLCRKGGSSCTVSERSAGGRCRYLIAVAVLLLSLATMELSPIFAVTVAIDVGHSPAAPGAISARGAGEYRFNREMADLLLSELRKNPAMEPILVNGQGRDISLSERVVAINALKPDLVISIHHDSVQPVYLSKWTKNGKTYSYCDRYHGYSIFFSEKNCKADESRRFADLLGSAMREAGLSPSLHHAEKIRGENRPLIDKEKGIYRFDELIILKSVEYPAVLLECGIIKNREEELLLSSPSLRNKVVCALNEAISRFKALGRLGAGKVALDFLPGQ
jgi:N-acetylmuramoyl-L-alanine amidase